MKKFRVRFEKKVYAYTDIEYESKEKLLEDESILWEQEWYEDSFNFPDEEWEISDIKEV